MNSRWTSRSPSSSSYLGEDGRRAIRDGNGHRVRLPRTAGRAGGALIELGHVGVLQADARVHLVNLNGEVVANALDGQVLPDRFHLLPKVDVVRPARVAIVAEQLPRLPLRDNHLDRLAQHSLRPHRRRVGLGGQPEVLLLEHLARARHGEVELAIVVDAAVPSPGAMPARPTHSLSSVPPLGSKCASKRFARFARRASSSGSARPPPARPPAWSKARPLARFLFGTRRLGPPSCSPPSPRASPHLLSCRGDDPVRVLSVSRPSRGPAQCAPSPRRAGARSCSMYRAPWAGIGSGR